MAEVKVPGFGESVSEAAVNSWKVKDGQYVERDQVIVELDSEKATVEVAADVAGVISLKAKVGDTVSIGQVIASIDQSASKPVGGPPPPAAAATSSSPQPVAAPAAVPTRAGPAARRMAAEMNLSADQVSQVQASGKSGRITKTDLLRFAEEPARPAGLPAKTAAAPVIEGKQGRSVKLPTIRKKIAERLVYSQQSTATLTTFNEVDLTNVIALRNKVKESFEKKNGVKLGFMSLFAKAVCYGIEAVPEVNARFTEDAILYHDFVDLGIAVGTDRGLVVPVVRDTHLMSFAQIEKAIGDYATKARDGKLSIDDMTGGTFTLTNGGVYGSLLSTPIINPPQSGILGMHKTMKRPICIGDQIVARDMMYIALSYDHRLVDGKGAVTFLVKVKEYLETLKEIEGA